MSWEDKLKKFDELMEKALMEEPYLDLPVIRQEFGIDDELDMLDSVIFDALLEEDLPSLPLVEPKIVQWIDWLEEPAEQQLESVSNAYAPQRPGQQMQPQPIECDICGMRFQCPVNLKRHKWRTCYKPEEENMDSTINQFKKYWGKLDDEKACKVVSIKDAVLPANVTEMQVDDLIDAVSTYIEASDEEHTAVIAFLLNPEAAHGCPPFEEILDTLRFLSDGTLFRGRLNPEMQRIVFPHILSMDEIREQGLLASFEFLVEYCMMKALADERNLTGNLLEEEDDEEAARKQMQSPASTSNTKKSKPSASQRRRQKARQKEELDRNVQHPDDEKVDVSKVQVEHDRVSRLNQSDSKGNEEYTEQDRGNVAATESSAPSSIDDSVQSPLPHQEMASESMKGPKPGDVIDTSSSRQPTASTKKARTHQTYTQRKKTGQEQSKQSKKQTKDKSSKDKKDVDTVSHLKDDICKQGEEDVAAEPAESKNQEQASADVAATSLGSVQSVVNLEQADYTSSALDHRKILESPVEGMERADLAVDLSEPSLLDDKGSLSEILPPETSGGDECAENLDNVADQAPEVDQQEHASFDAAPTQSMDAAARPSDLVQSVSDSVQGGDMPPALIPKKVTKKVVTRIAWADLPDSLDDLPRLPPIPASLLKHSEGQGKLHGELGSVQQIHIETGGTSRKTPLEYGKVKLLRRPSEAPAVIDSPAPQRDHLPRAEDSSSAPTWTQRESRDSTAASAESELGEGEEKQENLEEDQDSSNA